MKFTRAWLAAACVAVAAVSAAVPNCLIVHVRPAGESVPVSESVCDFVANELQAGGRVEPIVWGLSDPVYRAAVDENRIPSGDDHPAVKDVFPVAGKLRAEYVLAIDMIKGEGEVLGAAFLYKSGRLIWKDPDLDFGPVIAHLRNRLKKKEITQEEFDRSVIRSKMRASNVQLNSTFGPEDTVRSMARSWSQMIASGPLLSLPKKPEVETPVAGVGQGPLHSGSTPPKIGDDTKWKTDYTAALKAGEESRAVAILRDAIDAAPLDIPRRLALIKVLKSVGQPRVAALEARRAATLIPEHVEFRALAARCWMQSGDADEAQADLNEAITRNPESPDTLLLLGEVSIAKGDYLPAIDHLNKAVAARASGDAYYLRSLAYALSGDTERSIADTKMAESAGLSTDPEDAEARYALVAAALDEGVSIIGGEIRTIQQRALVQRTDREVKALFDGIVKLVAGRSAYVSVLPLPARHETSHNRRVLAYKLLSQCLTDLAAYLKTGDEDVLTESRINLGEALKQATSARLGFKDEQQRTSKSNAGPG